jgi:DNA-binding NtrC family response regulator
LVEILKTHKIAPVCVATMREYREILSKRPWDVVFCEPELTDGNFREAIDATRAAGSQARIILTSRLANWTEFLEAMRAGAFDVISAPCRPDDVAWVIMQATRDAQKADRPLMNSGERNKAHRAIA